MTEVTIRIDAETANKLDWLTSKTGRSQSILVSQAIEEFVSREAWQIAEIQAGLAEANQGGFASDAEVERVLGKYLHKTKKR
jgi:predicted transcriptional regulator